MNLKNVENKEKNTVVLTVEVPAEEFNAEVDKVYRKQKNRINVPGFRKGKAPRKIIEGMYGTGVFYDEAINALYPKALEDAIAEAKLDAVGYPEVEVETVGAAEGLFFKATVTLRPEVKISDYKGLEAEKPEVVITDADMDDQLRPFISQATRQVTVERPAQNGDTVNIDFDGYVDGKQFDGGKSEKYNLVLGSNSFIPGFEDQIVGMKAGEEKDINVTFPEDYHAELAGKAAVFKVKVHEVKESQAPELDDEFAKDVSEFDTLDELKADLKDKLVKRREEEAQKAFENNVLTALIEKMECDVPDTMVDFETDRMIREYASRFRGQSFTFEQYLSMMGTNLQEMKASTRVAALRQIQGELAYTAVADAEGLQPTDEEVEEEYKSLAEEYKTEIDKVKSIVPVEEIKKDLRMRQAAKLVNDSAVAVAPKPAEEEKPKKKASAKKAADEGEEKPKKKAAAKKPAAEEGEEKPKKKAPAKKTAKKTEE